jgi:hypothetical protein
MTRYHLDRLTDSLDINDPATVEIVISNDGKTLWLNVDGDCHYRCYRIGGLSIDDRRRGARSSVVLPAIPRE